MSCDENYIKELEKENELLKDKLDIAMKRRQAAEEKMFNKQYNETITKEIEKTTIDDIIDSIDEEFLKAVANYTRIK